MIKNVRWEGLTWIWQKEIPATPEKPCNGCQNPAPGPLQVFATARGGDEARWCRVCVDLVLAEPENRAPKRSRPTSSGCGHDRCDCPDGVFYGRDEVSDADPGL